MNEMLAGGARWAIARGLGDHVDIVRIEERGRVEGARLDFVSAEAKARQHAEMGTLGSGNHYLEEQAVDEILDGATAEASGLRPNGVVVTIN